VGRILTIIAALLLGLVGLSMSLCGGTFTVMSVMSPSNMGFLLIALPSAALGVFLLVVTYKIFRGLRE
jgi:hypothetical protein